MQQRLRYIAVEGLGRRNLWIGLGVGLSAIAVGMVVLRGADGEAKAFFAMLCLVLAIFLRHVLDDRAVRKQEGD